MLIHDLDADYDAAMDAAAGPEFDHASARDVFLMNISGGEL